MRRASHVIHSDTANRRRLVLCRVRAISDSRGERPDQAENRQHGRSKQWLRIWNRRFFSFGTIRKHCRAVWHSRVQYSPLETSFFLIALRRFPHALSTCAAAIETAIQASDVGAREKDGLHALVKKAKARSEKIAEFPDAALDRFREVRNRVTHSGFIPKDDSDASSLLLDVGFPFLLLCYSELHSFDARTGLLPEYSEQIDVATRVHSLAKGLSGLDLSYCFNGFVHLIRWCFKRNFSSAWEINALTKSEEMGGKYEITEEEKKDLEGLFDACWSFDCPICDEYQAVVCEIEANKLESLKVAPLRMACTCCGFVVGDSQPFLSEILLERQVADTKPEILKGYGIQ